ncbi:MAG: PDZ domain-containing protein [Planctomycetes bacterium]|nr:PDZ domain-containing protein [Planctomycetota bacterium]
MAKPVWILLLALAAPSPAQEKAPGFLGVRVAPAQKGDGVLVLEAMPESPAARAGLLPGDVLVELAGAPVRTPEELIALVRARAQGDEVAYVLRRGEGRIEGKLKLGASPPEAPPTLPLEERLDRAQKGIEELERRLRSGPRSIREWTRAEERKLEEARGKGDREGIRRAEIRIELLREMEAEGVRGLGERVDRIEKKVDRILERLGER